VSRAGFFVKLRGAIDHAARCSCASKTRSADFRQLFGTCIATLNRKMIFRTFPCHDFERRYISRAGAGNTDLVAVMGMPAAKGAGLSW
jgi:hypothetical protein